MMGDLALNFGGDLSIGPTGDLAVTDGSVLTEQRVLRRLLTNAGDYIWQLSYGAGLGQFVGRPGVAAAIAGVARMQMLQESTVSAIPPPVINVAISGDGMVTATLRYADTADGRSNLISFSI